MLWAGDRVDVYIGTRVVAMCKAREPVLALRAAPGENAMQLLNDWVQQQKQPARLSLWLSGGLCRPFVLPRLESKADELQKIATSLAPAQVGWSEPVAVRVDVSRKGRDAVAVAVKVRTIEQLKQALGVPRYRTISIRPWWAEVLRISLAREPHADCVAVQDCDSVCFIAGEGRSIEHAAVTSPIEDRTAAEAAIARLQFAQGGVSQPLRARLNLESGSATAQGASRAFDRLVEWIE